MAGNGDKKPLPEGKGKQGKRTKDRAPSTTVSASAPVSGKTVDVPKASSENVKEKLKKTKKSESKAAVLSKPASQARPAGAGGTAAASASKTKVLAPRSAKTPSKAAVGTVTPRQTTTASALRTPVDPQKNPGTAPAANRPDGRRDLRKAPPAPSIAQRNTRPEPSRTADNPPTTRNGGGLSYAEAAFGQHSTLPAQLSRNIERIEALTQRLIAALGQRRNFNPGVEAPGPDLFANATTAWLKLMTEQPARIIGQQVSYWGETLRHFAQAQAEMTRGTLTAPDDDSPADRRFSNPLWDQHPFFNFIKRQYQINAEAMQKATEDLEIEDAIERRRINWLTRQLIDMMAPTNFLATNPDALEKAFATEGESLVQGLENLVRDVEHHGGEVIVTLADRQAFQVGENIAATPGSVVARTKMYELIQYTPTTPKVHAAPVVIFPPWINKFYVLDLKPENSLIKWIVDQGFTLFVVAWKNPDASYAQTGLDDYVLALIEAMDQVLEVTSQKRLNVVGYCIAGTTLALTLALLKQRGDERVNSATFFTTLTDFSDQGEFTTFLQEDFVSGIEAEVSSEGILSGSLMQRTFSFLRANDLVWGPAIRSYMLGEAPPAFDLLFWNGDSTNLPGQMAMDYLRGLCQQNAFAQDGFEVLGQTLRLSDVTLPLCAIACETDHIAPWKDSWRGISQMGSDDRSFILSQSGHIAGIVNPPSKMKYGHYTSNVGFNQGSDDWLSGAQFHPGSWWQRWGEWLSGWSGPQVTARDPGQGLGPAPGSFVHEQA